MKIKLYILFLSAITLTSCNDSFMDKFPETSLTEKNFFKTVNDLKTYTDGFYGYVDYGYGGGDVSDDLYSNQGGYVYQLMGEEITPQKAGKWGWGSIRNINYLMDNYKTAVGPETEVNHYVGIARLNRAWEYYKKVRSYSDVPWYSQTIGTLDKELLYKTQDSREFVVDKIMEDLEFSSSHNLEKASKTRISVWASLSLQARIALEEASWRKYHSELELSDSKRFYEIARDAAKKVLDEGGFALNTASKDGYSAYKVNFISLDLSQNPEMIMYADFDKALRKHNSQEMLNNYYGFSNSLMLDYLVIKDNKAVPFNTIPDYDKKGFVEVFENRDPRMGDTFMKPGYVRADSYIPTVPKLGVGGYVISKFDPTTADQISWGASYTDIPMIRLAEVMLIYAEARAELGELTEADVDMTVNKLRERVGLPLTSLADMLSNIDPAQEQIYHNVSGAQKGAILEIRRERRVELAGEGKRSNDLYRWNLGKRFENFEGIYIKGLGYEDLTGDGQPDIAIVRDQAEADAIPEADKTKYKLVVYILDGGVFYLSNGDSGYIRMVGQRDKYNFVEPRYYYSPIAEQDILLNKNLKQNKFWE